LHNDSIALHQLVPVDRILDHHIVEVPNMGPSTRERRPTMRNPRLCVWPAEVLPVVELVRYERVDLRLIER
jgi:hypothetical protein